MSLFRLPSVASTGVARAATRARIARDHLRHGGLAVAAGDRDQRQREARAPARGERAERQPACRRPRSRAGPPQPGRDRRARPPRPRPAPRRGSRWRRSARPAARRTGRRAAACACRCARAAARGAAVGPTSAPRGIQAQRPCASVKSCRSCRPVAIAPARRLRLLRVGERMLARRRSPGSPRGPCRPAARRRSGAAWRIAGDRHRGGPRSPRRSVVRQAREDLADDRVRALRCAGCRWSPPRGRRAARRPAP